MVADNELGVAAHRHRSYVAVVVDEDGESYEYVSFAKNRRIAKKEVRASTGHWGATVVAIRPLATPKRRRRRELFVAVLTVGVSVLAIATMMLFWLGFEGLL